MARLMDIAFDVDDVLKPLVNPRWLDAINKEFGLNVRYEDVTSFDFLGKKEWLALLAPDRFDHSIGEPEVGAVEVATMLANAGHKLSTISASQRSNIEAKGQWLDKHFPMIGEKNQVWRYHKHYEAKPGRILVDDATHNLIGWQEHGGIAIALDRPWNQDWKGLRAKDFYHLESLLSIIEGGM